MFKIVKRLADLLAEYIVGTDGTKVFKGRTSLEFPDYDSLEAVLVKADQPLMAVISSPRYAQAERLADKKVIRTISNIEHTGTSQASVSLTGEHCGNNGFILEIVQAGPRGIATYKMSRDGGENFGTPETVPGNGQVDIGDGTILTFGSEGNLAAGDRYIWQTVSQRELIYQTDTFVDAVSINIHCATAKEFFGDDNFTGYLDQVREFFRANRAIHDGEFIYPVGLAREAQPNINMRKGLFYGVVAVIIEGSIYHKVKVPLISEVSVEV